MQEINKEKFEKLLIKHKKFIAGIGNKYKQKTKSEINLLAIAIKQAKELSLVAANFKCQKCGAEENLQYHHLILRTASKFIPFDRYLTQRYFWANIVVLCQKCHNQYHGYIKKKDTEELGCIPKAKIEKIKKKYLKEVVW